MCERDYICLRQSKRTREREREIVGDVRWQREETEEKVLW